MPSNDFNSLSLSSSLKSVLQELEFKQMTPIQAESIPLLLQNKDVIGQSQTGSGKTLAFALPILQKMDLENRQIQALVLCPTRELSHQVAKDIRKLARKMEGLQVLTVTGGEPGQPQGQALRRGVHIVVGTPGRILDHINRERMDFTDLKILVLDEADEMLDMGFEHDLQAIIQALPPKRQTVFFSATFPEKILSLSKSYQNNPQKIVIEKQIATAPQIQQIAYETTEEDRMNTFIRVLQQHPAGSIIVFSNFKASVAALGERLAEMNISSAALHGDLEQKDRDKVMTLFRNGSYRILVATDVAARGLDIQDLDLVINYDLPKQAEIYVHRIGRTGRMGKEGTAVTLVTKEQIYELTEIENTAGVKIEKGNLGFKNQHGLSAHQFVASMQTLWISGGRKDKVRPGDILGALTGEPNGIEGKHVGKIEIKDNWSFVAISSSQAMNALNKLRKDGIKGQKFHINFVK